MDILKNDPCYGKIPAGKVQQTFHDAWDTGIREAERFLVTHCRGKDYDMVRILQELGFRIIEENVDYVMGNVRYFCEYFPEKNQITVYSKGITLWAETNGMGWEAARNIILAHEFFHYLEAKTIGWMSRRCLVPMLKIGKFTLGKTGIAALSEVAANAFANTYYASYMKCVCTEETNQNDSGGVEL